MYVPGSENVVADALSCMYSSDSVGTVHAKSEYMYFDVVNEDNMDLEETMMPVLAGLEVYAAVQKRPRRVLPGAETGRLETSKEFAAHVKDCFVLRPPAERKEGGNGKTNEQLANSKKLTIKIPAQAKNTSALPRSDTGHQSLIEIDPMPKAYPSLLNVISESTDGIDFIRKLKGKYTDDPLFKTIIDKPREYKNFLVENGLVYLKSQGHKLLCIPNILIGKRTAREIVLTEAHSLLAHLGANKTLDYI